MEEEPRSSEPGVSPLAVDPDFDEPASDTFAASLRGWGNEASRRTERPEAPPPAKRKRNSVLTLDMKLKIFEQVEQGRNRQLIMKEYNLPSSTLSEIMKRKDEIRFAVSSSVFTGHRKRMRGSKYNDLEAEVWSWYSERTRKHKVNITGPEICQKAKEIAASMKLEEFNANSGWLCRFKQRRGIQATYCPRSKATSSDVDKSIATSSSSKPSHPTPARQQTNHTWTSEIVPEIMKRYQPKDIFTVGETCLFFRCTPDTMVKYLGEDCSCGKFAKDRLTIMVATNMLGTEKLPVLAVGKYHQPRCFKGCKTIPVEYMANAKAWMIQPFFEQWLRKLDDQVFAEGRNIALFVSPSEAHPRVPNLQAVTLIYLPPSHHFQPANQGILHTLKQNYRRSIIQRRLHFAEVCGPKEECHINLIDALHWLRSAWKDVTPMSIYKSFESSGFALQGYCSLVPHKPDELLQLRVPDSTDPIQLECDVMLGSRGQVVMDAEYGRMFERLAEKMVLDPYITADSYASLDDGVVTSGALTEEELQEAVARTKADEEEDEEEEVPLPPPTFVEAKQCLTKLTRFFAAERGTEQFFDKIARLYQHVSQASSTTPESVIIDLFSKKAKKNPKKKKMPVLEVE